MAISLRKPLKLVEQLLSEDFNELPKMSPRIPDCWFSDQKEIILVLFTIFTLMQFTFTKE